jgi:hypothetical protein
MPPPELITALESSVHYFRGKVAAECRTRVDSPRCRGGVQCPLIVECGPGPVSRSGPDRWRLQWPRWKKLSGGTSPSRLLEQRWLPPTGQWGTCALPDVRYSGFWAGCYVLCQAPNRAQSLSRQGEQECLGPEVAGCRDSGLIKPLDRRRLIAFRNDSMPSAIA